MAKCVLALKYLLGSDSYSACILLVRESLMVKSTVNKAGKANCLPGIDSTVNKNAIYNTLHISQILLHYAGILIL